MREFFLNIESENYFLQHLHINPISGFETTQGLKKPIRYLKTATMTPFSLSVTYEILVAPALSLSSLMFSVH